MLQAGRQLHLDPHKYVFAGQRMRRAWGVIKEPRICDNNVSTNKCKVSGTLCLELVTCVGVGQGEGGGNLVTW